MTAARLVDVDGKCIFQRADVVEQPRRIVHRLACHLRVGVAQAQELDAGDLRRQRLQRADHVVQLGRQAFLLGLERDQRLDVALGAANDAAVGLARVRRQR